MNAENDQFTGYEKFILQDYVWVLLHIEMSNEHNFDRT